MKLNTNANLLSIFSFVIGGLQLMLTLFFGVYVLLMGLVGVVAAFDPKAANDPEGIVVLVILAAVFGLLTLFGLIAAITNLVLGFKLRKPVPAGKRLVIFTSVVNCLSFMHGGMFAMALGVYGLWFALSDTGREYFEGGVYQPAMMYPSPANQYAVGSDYNPNYQDPHRWR
jgi:uncharacterized membrane protein HdeD (DUF308 family)